MVTGVPPAGADSVALLVTITGPLLIVAAVVVLGAILPFAASLVLDGLILVAMRRRFAALGVALAAAGLTAVAGGVLWSVGIQTPSGSSAASGCEPVLVMLTPASSALALIAFAARQLKNAGARRRMH